MRHAGVCALQKPCTFAGIPGRGSEGREGRPWGFQIGVISQTKPPHTFPKAPRD